MAKHEEEGSNGARRPSPPRAGEGPGVGSVVTNQRLRPGQLAQARDLRRRMTPAEHILWQALRGNRLDGLHFRRQQIIGAFIADFYCHAARLVVEVDGPIHQQQLDYDRERDQILAAHGLRIAHFTNDDDLHDLPGVLARLRHLCAQQSPPTP